MEKVTNIMSNAALTLPNKQIITRITFLERRWTIDTTALTLTTLISIKKTPNQVSNYNRDNDRGACARVAILNFRPIASFRAKVTRNVKTISQRFLVNCLGQWLLLRQIRIRRPFWILKFYLQKVDKVEGLLIMQGLI